MYLARDFNCSKFFRLAFGVLINERDRWGDSELALGMTSIRILFIVYCNTAICLMLQRTSSVFRPMKHRFTSDVSWSSSRRECRRAPSGLRVVLKYNEATVTGGGEGRKASSADYERRIASRVAGCNFLTETLWRTASAQEVGSGGGLAGIHMGMTGNGVDFVVDRLSAGVVRLRRGIMAGSLWIGKGLWRSLEASNAALIWAFSWIARS